MKELNKPEPVRKERAERGHQLVSTKISSVKAASRPEEHWEVVKLGLISHVDSVVSRDLSRVMYA